MHLRSILAAADDSEEGRAAITSALRLAHATGGSVAILTVITVGQTEAASRRSADLLQRHTSLALAELAGPPPVTHVEVVGLPGIEIGRVAEARGADLIILGRKRRIDGVRLLVGDTADAVARRSALPCLFVPVGLGELNRVVAALDGTERGFAVLRAAVAFTREIGGRLRTVTVEPVNGGDGDLPDVPSGRSAKLACAIRALHSFPDGVAGNRGRIVAEQEELLVVRRGGVVEEITREVDRSGAEVLVVGYHRGGQAGLIENGSVSRRLTHEAPCAVLTIPL